MAYPEKIWKGDSYGDRRIFVLGESWYGDYPDDLVTDDGYIRAYLEGRVVDALYTRLANACQLSRSEFWHGVMFTNYVQRVGATRDFRPAREHFVEAGPRLSRLLEEHQPRGVWILGIGQGEYSARVVEKAGIPFEVAPHPTSYGVKSSTLYASWAALLDKAKFTAPAANEAQAAAVAGPVEPPAPTASLRAYKRGVEFPHEGFVQQAIEAHFRNNGFTVDSGGRVDLTCLHPSTGEAWHIEAKGVTTQIGLDFRTGIGQLVQGMSNPSTRHALAVPDTPAFRTQVSKLSDWVVSRLGIHWLFVAPDGSIQVVAPSVAMGEP